MKGVLGFRFNCRGVTAIELMIAVAIMGAVAAIAAPAFQQQIERRRLMAAAETVLADLRWARSEAIKRNKVVRVTFATGDSWNYSISSRDDPTVGENTDIKAVSYTDYVKTTLSSVSFSGGVVRTNFNNVRGTAGAGTVALKSTVNNYELHVVLSLLGRSRICAVGSTMGGYDKC
jgi:prepilin-type N-terminal cleavage/methylation domain-containing protein